MDIKAKYLPVLANFAHRLRDVRFAGQMIFVVIVLLVSWSGTKSIQTNYGLQKQISALKQQDAVAQLQNNNLSLQNEYYNSNQYLELAARQNFGLAGPGETELSVPANVALSYTVTPPSTPAAAPVVPESAYARHIGAWLDFFLHRHGTTN